MNKADRVKAWHSANPEKVKVHKQRWRRKHPEQSRQCTKAYRLANPYNRRRWNWKRQGIDIVEAEAALRAHDGKCALCGVSRPGGTGRQWHVDHKHGDSKVRGILCAGCNLALGRVERVGVEKFATYLRGPAATAMKDEANPAAISQES